MVPKASPRNAVRAGLLGLAWAAAFGAPAAPIYSCTDATGKRLTSDRPIAECRTREQHLLNADGSVRELVLPSPTAEERSEQEQRERDNAAAHAARQDAIRRDRNLLARFPDAAAHARAREAALDDVRKSIRNSEARLAVLARERKPLLDESEFYVGKPLPAKLRAQLDANDALTDAQKTLIQNQQVELTRINVRYDNEFERLKKLWAGAQPGSMGAIVATPPAAATAK